MPEEDGSSDNSEKSSLAGSRAPGASTQPTEEPPDRTLSSVLNRLRRIVAGRSQVLLDYGCVSYTVSYGVPFCVSSCVLRYI